MDYGTQQTKKEMDLSHLSLKTNVYQLPVFTLKDGRKVSLNPNLMKVK
jgi:YbbR domain-containing protein